MFSGGLVGITIMVLIILCSVAAAGTDDRTTADACVRRVLMPAGLRERVQQQLAAGNFKGAFQACEAEPSFLSFIVAHEPGGSRVGLDGR